MVQCPAGGIDRGRIPQWYFCLSLHLWVPELLRRPVAFILIAGMTGEGEVGDPIGAAPCLRDDVLHFEGQVRLPAVGAAVMELLQNILPNLIPGQLAELIVHAANLRVL